MNTGEKNSSHPENSPFYAPGKKQVYAPGIFPVNGCQALTGYGMAID